MKTKSVTLDAHIALENPRSMSRAELCFYYHYSVKKRVNLKPRYNEPQYSEFRNLVNKTQLPF